MSYLDGVRIICGQAAAEPSRALLLRVLNRREGVTKQAGGGLAAKATDFVQEIAPDETLDDVFLRLMRSQMIDEFKKKGFDVKIDVVKAANPLFQADHVLRDLGLGVLAGLLTGGIFHWFLGSSPAPSPRGGLLRERVAG